MRTREGVLKEFGITETNELLYEAMPGHPGVSSVGASDSNVRAMADRIVHLERVLDALREPSAEMLSVLREVLDDYSVPDDVLRAALAQAQREADATPDAGARG